MQNRQIPALMNWQINWQFVHHKTTLAASGGIYCVHSLGTTGLIGGRATRLKGLLHRAVSTLGKIAQSVWMVQAGLKPQKCL